MLARLDAFLLDKAQKFCDKFQRVTGLTKFRLEKWSLIATAVCYLCSVILDPKPLLLLVLILGYIPAIVFTVHEIDKREKAFLENGTLEIPHFVATSRMFWVPQYVLFSALLLTVGDLGGKLAGCGCPFYIAWMYLVFCVPRPPSKSKMHEWLEKGLMWLRDSLPPAPIPVPNQ